MTGPVLYLHIGLMKTGTTYLQQLVKANRDSLARSGQHYAGSSWAAQVRAVQDLLHLDQHDPRIAALSAGAWPQLVDEVRGRRDGATLVSMEFLSFARRRALVRLSHDLAGVDLHVVVTVRDANRTIPAQWQTSISSGSTHTWPAFQKGVRRARGPLWVARAMRGDSGVREFRRTQDLPSVLRRWSRVVPPDRLHVVTVPHSQDEPDLLWRRFAEVLGVAPEIATEPAAQSNPSLGFASAELLRRINEQLEDVLPWDYNHTLKAQLGSKILSARRRQETRVVPDPETAEFAGAWNARWVEAVGRSGAHVVGDLADLPVVPPPVPATGAVPGPEELLAAARDAWSGLVALVERRRARVANILGAQRPAQLVLDEPGWLTPGARSAREVERAVRDLADLSRTAIQLRREVLELRESDDESDVSADVEP